MRSLHLNNASQDVTQHPRQGLEDEIPGKACIISSSDACVCKFEVKSCGSNGNYLDSVARLRTFLSNLRASSAWIRMTWQWLEKDFSCYWH